MRTTVHMLNNVGSRLPPSGPRSKMVRCEADIRGFTSPFSHSLVTMPAVTVWMNGAFTPGATNFRVPALSSVAPK